jgi:hypothetical protein
MAHTGMFWRGGKPAPRLRSSRKAIVRFFCCHNRGNESQEKMFQPCALGISHDEQKINPRIIILH